MKFKELLRGAQATVEKILTPKKEEKIECAIDDEVVDCAEMSDCMPPWGHSDLEYLANNPSSYTGIPAPAYLEDDEWFGPAPAKSEKQLDYMEKEVEIKRQEREENFSVEPDNIHELMYNMATSQQSTTLHLDPPSTPGGSENFQGGDNGYGWMSGTGMGQFT